MLWHLLRLLNIFEKKKIIREEDRYTDRGREREKEWRPSAAIPFTESHLDASVTSVITPLSAVSTTAEMRFEKSTVKVNRQLS